MTDMFHSKGVYINIDGGYPKHNSAVKSKHKYLHNVDYTFVSFNLACLFNYTECNDSKFPHTQSRY